MDRRKFVQSTLLPGAVLGGLVPFKYGVADMEENKKTKQQWYELRAYVFANAAQRQLTETYLEQAYLPALNRAGLVHIGVFSEYQPEGIAKLFVLIPFDSMESFAAIDGKLLQDREYLQAGQAYLAAEPTAPGYERIESSLLRAFHHMPVMEVPEKKERLLELRRYESPSESAGQKKIEMFNDAGEIDIFKRIGARPVFFGEMMIGGQRPNLTYMLCFDNMEVHDARWKTFIDDPEWKKVSAIPDYSNARLISQIVRTFLVPTAYSQV